MLVALLFCILESHSCILDLPCVVLDLFSNVVPPLDFLSIIRLLSFELLDLGFESFDLLCSLLLFRLTNLDVFLKSLERDFELSSYLREFFFFCLVLLIKQPLAVDEGFIILNLYPVFFGSFDFFVAVFQKFCPIGLDIFKLTDDVE